MGDLGEYRRRRDRRRTPAPMPEEGPQETALQKALPRGDDDTFVVQEHHARSGAPTNDGAPLRAGEGPTG